MHVWEAVFAFLVAAVAAVTLTPLTAAVARRLGAVAQPSERGLAERPTPQLGGVAILVAVIVPAVIWIPATIHLPPTAHAGHGPPPVVHSWGIIAGAGLITLVGVIDDIVDLRWYLKLVGQIAAGLVAVAGGVVVTDVTLPFIGSLQFPHTGGALSVVWLVGLMNVINFSDGVDGLAAGVTAIDAVAFTAIAYDLHVWGAGVLSALTAGAALGFLVHNFHPARIFMGDSGANLLGFLLGTAAVIGSVKTNAVVALAGVVAVLAVPLLDTGFVVAKRLKYRRKPWSADANHFHHRMARIGFSQRRTVAYMYAWTAMLAALALALKFIPYHHHAQFVHQVLISPSYYRWGWVAVLIAIAVLAAIASVYVIYVLEILKFKTFRWAQMRSSDPDTSEHQAIRQVEQDLETGEFERVR